MDKIIQLPLGALATNCYIVPADDGRAIVVDPASTGEIMAILETNDMELGAILITHGHFDHFSGAAALKERTGVPIYAPDLDSEMFQSSSKSWAWFVQGTPFAPITPDHLFVDGEEFSLLGTDFLALNAPGHTAGSCLLICDKWDCIFTGDVIFRGSVGRTDGYSGSAALQNETLRKLRGIEHNYKLYCGHGDSSDINTEKLTNPYLLDL